MQAIVQEYRNEAVRRSGLSFARALEVKSDE